MEKTVATLPSSTKTVQIRNLPKLPESAIKSESPTEKGFLTIVKKLEKNSLFFPFVALTTAAHVMLIICACACVGIRHERNLQQELEKASVTVERASVQLYNSILNDAEVNYDIGDSN